MILLFLSAAGLLAGANFIGAERCKLCHRDVYQSWTATPHGTRVPSDFEERCLRCHATEAPRLPAVQCESCHGPGSDYAQPEVMIDPEKAAMAGLVRPSVVVCERCHQNDEPGHRGTFVMPESNEWGRVIHEMKDP